MTESDPTPPARILLVEDSEHDRRFFCRHLESAGESYDVTTCPNAECGLEKLREQAFDLLVVDLNMPGMGGMELIRRARPLLNDTGVIILSGARSFDAAADALRLHVIDYIVKEPRDLLKTTLAPQIRRALDTIRLVRENRRLERELRLRLTHLEQIHRQMPEAIFATIGPDQRLTEINEQCRGLLEAPDEIQLEGRPIGEILTYLSEDLSNLVMDHLRTGRPIENLYVEAPSPRVRDRLLLLGLSRVQDADVDRGEKDLSWVLTVRDVTPRSVRADKTDGAIFHGIVGQDRGILEMCELIRRVAPMPTSVLITGPTGSGKEVVARAIHAESDRSNRPFIAVNCTALSREILESELFGHVKGAFTGAVNARKGRFREADRGTLFLDEIGDTSYSFQSKLLRALETGEIDPVGQDRPTRVDVRILCATNRDLTALVREGRFREDLFYRINVVRIELSPLSDRPGDLPLLLDVFRREFNERFGKSIRNISTEAMRVMARHQWPGNVRELRHVLEHAFVVSEGPTITRADLPPALVEQVPVSGRSQKANIALDEMDSSTTRNEDRLDEISRIESVLQKNDGNIGEAAGQLNMHRTTLWRKMRKYGIHA